MSGSWFAKFFGARGAEIQAPRSARDSSVFESRMVDDDGKAQATEALQKMCCNVRIFLVQI